MTRQQFESLMATEEGKLAELTNAAAAAQAAQEGAESAIVHAKLDGASAAELRRMEADVEAAVAARDSADRAVGRQRDQIGALREAYAQRTHVAETAAAEAELEAARSAWPAALAAWDAAVAGAEPLWAEMCRLTEAERGALKRLERLGAPSQSIQIPTVAKGEFPISKTLLDNLHWTFEGYRTKVEERRQSQEQGRALADMLSGRTRPTE